MNKQDPMEMAFQLAIEALNHGEVPVGAVITWKGNIVAKGRNKTNEKSNAIRHAEFEALDELKDWNHLNEMDIYVTCEPCIMCASALRELNIRHVYFGCRNPRFGGNGTIYSIHEQAFLENIGGYSITGDIQSDRAILLLQQFYEQENPTAPLKKRNYSATLKQNKKGDAVPVQQDDASLFAGFSRQLPLRTQETPAPPPQKWENPDFLAQPMSLFPDLVDYECLLGAKFDEGYGLEELINDASSSSSNTTAPSQVPTKRRFEKIELDVDTKNMSKSEIKRLKNTMAARQSRQRKVDHVKELEGQIQVLETKSQLTAQENAVLLGQNLAYEKRIAALEKQIVELHQVLLAFGKKNETE